MIRASRRSFPPAGATDSVSSALDPTADGSSPYGPSFWKSYLSNTLVTVAIAILYRYADFVTYLGGSELHLGWIVGVGTLGSLAMRVFLGTGIDRYGARLVWLSSLGLFAVTCLGHTLITRYDGPAIYILRIFLTCAIAGIFGSSMTFISGRAPVVRMAEMLGMLGTSGFLGMVLGSHLADLLIDGPPLERGAVDRMFLVAGALAGGAMMAAWWATRGYTAAPQRRRPPMLWLVRRYFPGPVLLVGMVMGFAYGLPATFLPTYADTLGIPRIGLFFTVYAVTAIATRVLARQLPQRLGTRPMVIFGLAVLVISQLLFVLVRTEWHLAVPAVTFGISHAILFPTAMAESCGTFPVRHRGLATMLMLAAYDVGLLIGSPTAGMLVHLGGRLGLPGYPVMFLSVSAIFALAMGVYVGTGNRGRGAGGSVGLGKAQRAPAAGQEARSIAGRVPSPGGNGHAARVDPDAETVLRPTSSPADGNSRSTAAGLHANPPAARSPAASGPG